MARLLRARRQELHARVAAVLAQDFRRTCRTPAGIAGAASAAAGDNERAVEQWLKAGQRAADGLAHVEAIAHLQRGLSLLASLPETPGRNAREIQLQLALGHSTLTVKGVGSQETADAYTRARQLAEQHGDDRQSSGTVSILEHQFGHWRDTGGASVRAPIGAGRGPGRRRRTAASGAS